MASLNTKETTRRPHKKSRYGCKSCKTRRLKCDETKPTCVNCTKNDIACEYLFLSFSKPALSGPAAKKLPLPTTATVTRRNAHFSRPVSRDPISFSFPTSVTSSLSDSDKLLEFRLFQHFVNVTDVSQVVSVCKISLWVIQLACRHRSIMDALLGVSAFHLRSSFSSASSPFPTSTIPESKFERDVVRASHHYMGRAIAAHRRLVVEEGVTERTGDAVLGSCLFIMYHAAGSQKFLGHAHPSTVSLNENIDAQNFRVPLHWFVPMKSLKNMMNLAGTYVRDEGMRAQIEWEEASFRVILQNETSPDPENDHPTIFNFLFDDLSFDAPDYKIYALCANYLNIIGGGKIAKFILKFPALVPLRFVELLKERDMRVMGIVGYFLMLMKRADIEKKLWWMTGAVENDWVGMKHAFERDELWKKRMEWARREIERGEVIDFETGEALARGRQIE
ncbi:0d7cdde0-28ae-462f-a86f-f7fb82b723fa [Sclerotinia trifoliorum]|uniref:0d7cdde0-28ae-462f-a86f-f7fb82b723fa n=1 Tax=Sclerotinia trifoliorum TaxID=28548 RepID=A0A8H2ZRY1_9HELO|nr:0d7cdde0-28ae-462f-a86f-f7fb82b723fa [Sclerotinia trifoliorum]